MEKYLVKEVEEDYLDIEEFLDLEEESENVPFWIGGNKNFKSYGSIVDKVSNKCFDCYEDIYRSIARDYDNDEITEEEYMEKIKEEYNYYFGKFGKKPEKLNTQDLVKLHKAVPHACEYTNDDERYDAICEILGICYEEEFDHCEISGSSQGEWQEIVYPKSMDKEYLDYLESIYFGTGTVVEVTESKHDESENINDIDDDWDRYYSSKYSEQEILKDISHQTGIPEPELIFIK